MSYSFVLGGSGSGKSTEFYKFIIEEAVKYPNKQYLIIVPDQFTLAVQKQVTNMHPGKCILNIDVLSFSRMGHRIFSEMGESTVPVLDDTGKNLILSSIGARLENQLKYLSGKLHKPGIIEQVKSLISEFMQYGIGEKEIDELIALAEKNMRVALGEKLQDVKLIYRTFLEEIKDKYDTRETRLSLLARQMSQASLLDGATVVFDGFTGFTPVQHCVLETIIGKAEKVYFAFLWDTELDPNVRLDQQALFYLSSKAIDTIRKIGDRAGKLEDKPLLLTTNKRFINNPPMEMLEKSLFRSGYKNKEKISCEGKLQIYATANPYDEIKLAAGFIKKLTTEEGYAYRDIAMCCGNLEEYIEPIRRVFAENNIPGYIDVRKKVKDNPLVEYINGILRLEDRRYSYESVFTCIKNIFSNIDMESADRLENYCLANGIKGKKRWMSPYFGYSYKDEELTEELNQVESIRALFVKNIPIPTSKLTTMGEYVGFVRTILEDNDISGRLLELSEEFANSDESRAQEYRQVYDYMLYCLEQIETFVPEETTDATRFLEVFNSAISELTVGTIPQNVDRILVGDMERTRFSNIKVMMVLGVNEGSIPKTGGQTGILSVNDRQLFEGAIELSPGPRELMYRQRLYLYMNITQPSDLLYMSYSRNTSTGKEKQPSYLIRVIENIYSDLKERKGKDFFNTNTYTRGMLKEKCAEFLREAVSRNLVADTADNVNQDSAESSTDSNADNILDLAALNAYIYLTKKNPELAQQMLQAAFYVYRHSPLGSALAEAVYGTTLSGNISAFQDFYTCPYKYFLEYGLKLKERDKFDFGYNDTGNMIHKVLETIGDRFDALKVNWEDATDEEIDNLLEDIISDIIKPNYKYKLEYSGKNRYNLHTAARVAARTVRVLSYHFSKGEFKPQSFEKRFTENIELKDNHSLSFKGTIDRIDVAKQEDVNYFKVTDYKTGSKEPDLIDVYNGLSLQLPMYMYEVLKSNQGIEDKKSIPAAMLIYSAQDPLLTPDGEITEEKLQLSRLEALKSKGFINSEAINLLDREAEKTSDILVLKGTKLKSLGEVSLTKNGIYSETELNKIMNYTKSKITQAGNEIYEGNIAISPYKKGVGVSIKTGCDYCGFKKICGIDSGLPGMEYRELQNDVSKILAESEELK